MICIKYKLYYSNDTDSKIICLAVHGWNQSWSMLTSCVRISLFLCRGFITKIPSPSFWISELSLLIAFPRPKEEWQHRCSLWLPALGPRPSFSFTCTLCTYLFGYSCGCAIILNPSHFNYWLCVFRDLTHESTKILLFPPRICSNVNDTVKPNASKERERKLL